MSTTLPPGCLPPKAYSITISCCTSTAWSSTVSLDPIASTASEPRSSSTMQPTKDSFYVALRDRLVVVDPNRTVTLDGATRPAIAVLENEPPTGAPLLPD